MKITTITLGVVLAAMTLTGPTAMAQSKAAYGQQLFLLKSLKPSAKTVGIIGASLTDQEVQSLTRAGMGVGLSVVVGRPANARDVAVIYKKLISDNKVDLLLVVPGGGDWFSGASVEYLVENSVLDRVGLCVPSLGQMQGGALCTIQSDNGKLVVHVNQKVANVVGATVPAEQNSSIAYVVR
jgi:ABC-type uncharacterized transport system substrate-binding protein